MRHRSSEKTWVEINCGQLRANMQLLRQAIGPHRTIILVVKSDAYGHGADTVTRVAAEEGIDHFGVATVAEGQALRRSKVIGEIILLHPPFSFEIDRALAAGLSPTISSFDAAALVNSHAAQGPVGVHIEINTGVNRLGLDWETAIGTVGRIAKLENIRIAGIFTHFRATDSQDVASLKTQVARFQQVITNLRQAGTPVGLCHAASSHAVTYFPPSYLEGVRPGMMVYYGVNGNTRAEVQSHSGAIQISEPLTQMRPVMSVFSRVLHPRRVAAGEWIHYGEMYRAASDMEVAVVPIGYGMGYPRALSNNADMLIHGHRAPVVGAVGMDMTIVATDGLPPVAAGDRVTIMGQDGKESISAEELAQRAETIPYEILCRLGNSLPRSILKDESRQRSRPKGATADVRSGALQSSP